MESHPASAGRQAMTPDDALPPVEPPGAGFIVQLFVVPAVIVVFIVVVWFLFNWLAQMGANPQAELEAMRGNRSNRWQAAATLADMLNSQRYDEIKRDPAFAIALGEILIAELDAQPTTARARDDSEMMQVYLCNALGLIETPEALPPLLTAARQTAGEREMVRRAALESLAVWASHLPDGRPQEKAQLLDVFRAALDDPDALVRLRGAFGLGLLNGPEAAELLTARLTDLSPEVRYNAATGLARQGNTAGVDVLVEMLDPQEIEALVKSRDAAKKSRDAARPNDAEATQQALVKAETRLAERAVVVQNGLGAVLELRKRSPDADLAAIEAMLNKLIDAEVAADFRVRAKEVRIGLKNRPRVEAAAGA